MSRFGRLSCLIALAAVAGGCGAGLPRSHRHLPRIPSALAQQWASEADQIAVASSSGDGCRAQDLVRQLSAQVNANENEVPERLRVPLLTSVSTLAREITCTPKPPKKPKGPPPGYGHGHGDGGGDQGNQG